MKAKHPIIVTAASFLRDHLIAISFSDGVEQEVDLGPFLNADTTPAYLKEYKEEKKFKTFKLEDGNLVWGKDWDLIFPLEQLYIGIINIRK